jgi:uncharacterized membrane protein
MNWPLRVFAHLSLLSTGAIFGFFYAWVCSTMWGLDAADPSVAIAAMQAMNASVRNIVFAPAFFGTPVVLLVTAVLARQSGRRVSARAFMTAALVYLFAGLVLTALVNVPMNEALATIRLPLDPGEAEAVWSAYSEPWQVWNTVRACASGLALMLTGYGLVRLGANHAQ